MNGQILIDLPPPVSTDFTLTFNAGVGMTLRLFYFPESWEGVGPTSASEKRLGRGTEPCGHRRPAGLAPLPCASDRPACSQPTSKDG